MNPSSASFQFRDLPEKRLRKSVSKVIANSFRAQAAPPYSLQNSVKLVRGGREYFRLLEQMILEAHQSIHLQMYIYEDDKTGKQIARALKEAARRNVDVFVLLDGYASQDLPDLFIENLSKAGVHFRWFDPLLKSKFFYFGRRLHHKVVVVDSCRSLIGGINISDRYNDIDGHNAWLDWAIYIEGEASATVEKICSRRMKLEGARNEAGPPSLPLNQMSSIPVRVRINDWVRAKREITNSYLEMIRRASSSIIVMSPYFLPGREMRRALSQATRRGVSVKLILAGRSDIVLAKYAERFMYDWLFRNTIGIYEYQQNVLHGKVAVCDCNMVTIGSYNLNNISAYASIELNVDVKDAAFAAEVHQRLSTILERDCVQITKEIFNHRTNLFHRFLHRSAYDIIRILLFIFTFYFRQRE